MECSPRTFCLFICFVLLCFVFYSQPCSCQVGAYFTELNPWPKFWVQRRDFWVAYWIIGALCSVEDWSIDEFTAKYTVSLIPSKRDLFGRNVITGNVASQAYLSSVPPFCLFPGCSALSSFNPPCPSTIIFWLWSQQLAHRSNPQNSKSN